MTSFRFSPFSLHLLPPPEADGAPPTLSYTPTPPLLLLLLFEGVLHVSISCGVVACLLYLPSPSCVIGSYVRPHWWLLVAFGQMIMLLDGFVPVLYMWWSLSGYIYSSSVSFLLFPFLSLFLFCDPFGPMRTFCILSVGIRKLALRPFRWLEIFFFIVWIFGWSMLSWLTLISYALIGVCV